MSPLFENAIDSLKVGMGFYLADKEYSTRKHAILTIFHSIELLLKEYLYRVNPILIYRSIDKKIREDSITVGIVECLVRLENLNIGLHKQQKSTIEKIQKRRNRIEHHRYDHAQEDEEIIAESLRFILCFLEFSLKDIPSKFIDTELLENINRIVFEYNERRGVADHRLEEWLSKNWPEWDKYKEGTPDDFEGTLDCPNCRQEYLARKLFSVPFCFWCNAEVDADECEICCCTKLRSEDCCILDNVVELPIT